MSAVMGKFIRNSQKSLGNILKEITIVITLDGAKQETVKAST